MSASFQGAFCVLKPSIPGQGSIQALGAAFVQPITLGFCDWTWANKSIRRLGSPSTSLAASAAALRSSGPASTKTTRCGAGAFWKPVLAPHHLSLRSKSNSVGLAFTSLYGPVQTGHPLARSKLLKVSGSCPSQMCLGTIRTAPQILTAKLSYTKRGLAAFRTTCTVSGSVAVTSFTPSAIAAAKIRLGCALNILSENTTSSAVKGCPSFHSTPLRSGISKAVKSAFHFSVSAASQGTALPV